jgi:hypothetical protein
VGSDPRARGWSAAFGRDEEARRFAFFALGDRCPRSMTRGPGPPCQGLDHLGARQARTSTVLQGVSGGIFL